MKRGVYEYNKSYGLIVIAIIFIIVGINGFFRIESSTDMLTNISMIILPAVLICYILDKNNTYKTVIEKGIKVPGVIVKPEKVYDSVSEYGGYDYYLYIKYIDPNTNQEVEFKTERLAINPFKSIKSANCMVYIYEDKVIAEDFELTNNKDECIYRNQENENYTGPDKKGMGIILAVALIILAIGIIIMFSASMH